LSRALRAAAIVLLVLGATAMSVASGPGPASGCSPLEPMHGVGLVCSRADGLLDVFTPSGEYVGTTHGPDPVPGPEEVGGIQAAAAPACVSGAPGTYYTRVIYARAHDDGDGYATWLPRIRALVASANQAVADAGTATGARVDIKVRCVEGSVEVANEVLPTAKASASFSTIVSDLKAKGHTDGRVKHWVLYDDTGACGCGGMGHIYGDDRPGAENWNNGNGAPLFAVDFGYDSTRIWLHELGHNLGAVQNSAPRSTGAHHCIDGLDIMCYADGGPNAPNYTTTRCSAQVFDCGKDDYFHAGPGVGSYLATHWNLGNRVNRYFLFGHPMLTGLSCVSVIEVAAPASCSVVGTDDSPGVRYVFDWGDGNTSNVPESGFEPPGVIRETEHAYAAAGAYDVSVHMVDTDGLVSSTRTARISVEDDLTPPVLSVADPVVGHVYRGCGPSTATSADRVVWFEAGCVRADATDARSGVARVEARVDGVVRAVDTEAPYEVEVPLPRGYWLNARIDVVAIDHAGNPATFTVRGYLFAP
jgi:hypothetical protein